MDMILLAVRYQVHNLNSAGFHQLLLLLYIKYINILGKHYNKTD